jgi:uncharacterized protein (TIGR00251 family)
MIGAMTDSLGSIALKAHAEGVLIPVQARPGARRPGILGVHDGRLRIGVSAVAEKGKANDELLRLLAEIFRLSRSRVQLVHGATSRQKQILLTGISVAESLATLSALMNNPASNRSSEA